MGIFIIDCVCVIWCYVLNVFEFIGDKKFFFFFNLGNEKIFYKIDWNFIY